MVLELSAGAEVTGASFAEFKRLETKFSLSLGVPRPSKVTQQQRLAACSRAPRFECQG